MNSDTFNTEENWSAELIQEMIDQGDRVTIDFNKTISVYIMYVTCWVSRENKIQFREDFYKHDKGILQSIKGL